MYGSCIRCGGQSRKLEAVEINSFLHWAFGTIDWLLRVNRALAIVVMYRSDLHVVVVARCSVSPSRLCSTVHSICFPLGLKL
jgi:hypothetical protein